MKLIFKKSETLFIMIKEKINIRTEYIVNQLTLISSYTNN